MQEFSITFHGQDDVMVVTLQTSIPIAIHVLMHGVLLVNNNSVAVATIMVTITTTRMMQIC